MLAALDRVPVEGRRSIAVLWLGPGRPLLAHAARSRGARRVVGVDPVRRAHDLSVFGIDEQVLADARDWADAAALPAPELVVEAVGHRTDTFGAAVAAVAPQGSVLCFGIPDQSYSLAMERLMRQNLTVIGELPATAGTRCAVLFVCRRDPRLNARLVTHRYDRESVQQAFEPQQCPPKGCGKSSSRYGGTRRKDP